MWGGQLDVNPIYPSGLCGSELVYIPNSKSCFLKCFQSNANHALLYPTNDLQINKLNFSVGHGTVVQLGCTITRL